MSIMRLFSTGTGNAAVAGCGTTVTAKLVIGGKL
jgi:hypothetical protein